MPARPATARPRTGTARPQSARPKPSRPSESSHGSSSHRPPRSRQGSSSRPSGSRSGTSHRREGGRPKTGAYLTTVEEDEATNEEVIREVRTLRSTIEQFSYNFHDIGGLAHGMALPSFIRREVGVKAIDVATRNIDGSTVAVDLRDRLARYALDPEDPARTEALVQICRTAGRLRRKIGRHAGSWRFDTFDDEATLFPSVTLEGRVLIQRETGY